MSTMLTTPAPSRIGGATRDQFKLMRQELDDLLTRFWSCNAWGLAPPLPVPNLDLVETDTAVEVRMDLPGMRAEDIHVDVQQDLLTVSGERKEDKEVKQGNGRYLHRIERNRGSFSRTVILPCPIVSDRIEATYHDGVLSLNLPKTEPTDTRSIAVKAV